jgi:hypothetical protein
MSALPAEITETSPVPIAPRPAPAPGATPAAAPAAAKRRAERRAEEARARAIRRKWAAFCIAVFLCFFGLTVGILDVLH